MTAPSAQRSETSLAATQPQEASALRNVFGSQASLAELNGDVSSTQVSRRPSPMPSPAGRLNGLASGKIDGGRPSFSLGGSAAAGRGGAGLHPGDLHAGLTGGAGPGATGLDSAGERPPTRKRRMSVPARPAGSPRLGSAPGSGSAAAGDAAGSSGGAGVVRPSSRGASAGASAGAATLPFLRFGFAETVLRLVILIAGGLGQSYLLLQWLERQRAQFETALGAPMALPITTVMGIDVLAATTLGLGLPTLDVLVPDHRVLGGRALPRSDDWLGIVRAGAGLLGVTYAVTKLTSAWALWALANPLLWYVGDATRNGFWFASFVSVLGTAIVVAALAGDVSVAFRAQTLPATAGIAAALFGTAICFGNLGRRLFAPPARPASAPRR